MWTAKRNFKGLVSPTYVQGSLIDSAFIATPSLGSTTTTTTCSTGKQVIDSVNYLYAPDTTGGLITLFQTGQGMINVYKHNEVTSSSVPLFGAPAVIQDVVLFGGGDGNLHVAGTQGNILLTIPIAAGYDIASGVAISNGRIYFGANNSVLYCMSIGGQ